jgi:hypothetical protein
MSRDDPEATKAIRTAWEGATRIDGTPAEAGQHLLSSEKADEKCSL